MTTYSEAVEQTITAGEQIHQIVNGTATTEVTVEDGSKVPSIRKALLDNFYFKDPIAWQVGQTENVFNQLRKFTDGSWWYAPSATANNPISMGSTPIGDSLWKIYDFDAIGKLGPRIDEALRRSYAEAGYNVVGTFQAGFTIVNSNDVGIDLATGKGYTGPAGAVAAGTDPMSGGFVDRSGVIIRGQLAASAGSGLVGHGGGTVKSALDYIMMSYPLDSTDYLPEGYVTDGSVSYTAEMQQALNDAAGFRAILLPNFKVLIDPAGTTYGGLQVPSNSKVVFQIGSSLKIKPNNLINYEIIGIRDKLNVEVFNAVLYGDKYTHTGTAGEFGMGIAVRGACQNINIHRPKFHDFWGDGMYIGQTANDIASTAKNVTIQSPRFYNCRRQGVSVTSVDGLFIDDMGVWDTKSSDSPTPLPNGPHAGIDIEPNGSFSMLRNIRITGLHGGGNDAGLFYVFLGAITNTADDPYHVDITVDGVSDDGSLCAIQLVGLNKDAKYSGSIKISNVSSNNAKLNGIRVRNWPIQCGLQATIDNVSISDWLSSATEPARSRSAITSYTTEANFPTLGNLSIKGITLRQSRPAADVSERAFHGENADNGLSNISLAFDNVQSTIELKAVSDGLTNISSSGDFASGLKRTITGSTTLAVGEVCDYVVAPSGANPTVTMSTFTVIRAGQKARFKYIGGGTSTAFRLRTAIGVPMYVNSVSGTNFIFDKSSGVVELTYADGAFVVRCDGAYTKES